MVEDLTALVRRGIAETPPLPHGYGERAHARDVPMNMMPRASRRWTRCSEELRAKGVRYVIGAYVDIHGAQKAKVVPLGHLAHMAEGSASSTRATRSTGSASCPTTTSSHPCRTSIA